MKPEKGHTLQDVFGGVFGLEVYGTLCLFSVRISHIVRLERSQKLPVPVKSLITVLLLLLYLLCSICYHMNSYDDKFGFPLPGFQTSRLS